MGNFRLFKYWEILQILLCGNTAQEKLCSSLPHRAHCDEPLNKNQNKQISQKPLFQKKIIFSCNFFIYFEMVSKKKKLA
jgi:hypothetical protein